MNCPKCGGESSVRETRRTEYGLRRRRFCDSVACGTRFTTAEVIIPGNAKALSGHGLLHLVFARDLDSIVELIMRIRSRPMEEIPKLDDEEPANPHEPSTKP